jgi:hypothetical protein
MADIFDFPLRSKIEITRIESFFRNELKKFGFAREMEDEIMTGMKRFLDWVFVSFNFPTKQFPFFSDDQIIFIKNTIYDFMNRVLCDRFKVECELYNLRHRDEF